jgi:hypothetical protein
MLQTENGCNVLYAAPNQFLYCNLLSPSHICLMNFLFRMVCNILNAVLNKRNTFRITILLRLCKYFGEKAISISKYKSINMHLLYFGKSVTVEWQ